MPQINLLSPGSKRKTVRSIFLKTGEKAEISQVLPTVIVRTSISAGVCFVAWIFLFLNVSAKQKILKGYEDRVQVLSTNPIEMEKIRNEKGALEKKVQLIDDLSSRKFLWFEKLEQITNLIPNGVWLTEINTKDERGVSTTSNSGKSVVIGLGERTILTIRGTAVAYKIQDAVSLIGDFIQNLQGEKKFADDFQDIKLNTATKSAIGSMDVMRFDFVCESK